MKCNDCGGQMNLLGQLGNRMHARCENCGMDASVLASEYEPEQDWTDFDDEDDDYDPVEEYEREEAREEAADRLWS